MVSSLRTWKANTKRSSSDDEADESGEISSSPSKGDFITAGEEAALTDPIVGSTLAELIKSAITSSSEGTLISLVFPHTFKELSENHELRKQIVLSETFKYLLSRITTQPEAASLSSWALKDSELKAPEQDYGVFGWSGLPGNAESPHDLADFDRWLSEQTGASTEQGTPTPYTVQEPAEDSTLVNSAMTKLLYCSNCMHPLVDLCSQRDPEGSKGFPGSLPKTTSAETLDLLASIGLAIFAVALGVICLLKQGNFSLAKEVLNTIGSQLCKDFLKVTQKIFSPL